jgi:hypothetical protein
MDSYPEDISWSFIELQESGSDIIQQESGYNVVGETYEFGWCVPADGCYEFTINDSYGDGFLSGPGYTLSVDGVEVMSYDGEASGESISFGCESNPTTVTPTIAPTHTSSYESTSSSTSTSTDESTSSSTSTSTVGSTSSSTSTSTGDSTSSSTHVSSGNGCDNDEIKVEWTVTMDSYPEDISWLFFEKIGSGLKIIQQESGYNVVGETYEYDWCVPADGCYELSINDSWGDGFLSGPGYTLSVDGVEVMSYDGEASGEWFAFGCS